MAIIAGVTVNWSVSPRIIVIPIPLTEATIEDLQDTLLDLEASEEGMVFQYLRDTTGGEDLGGGTSVGFTMELQNAQVQFAGRTTAIEFGAVSSNDTTGTLLNAVGGLFVTNGVSRGDTVFNSTTGSMATILSVTDETNLVSQQITGGARTTWLNTDNYSIYRNVQCSIEGGNLVAVDGVGSTISPVLQSPNTNVIRTSASSATTQNQEQLEAASFTGKEGLGVNLNTAATPDTNKILGNRENPTNTEASALSIAVERGFRNIYLATGPITLTDDYSNGYVFFGDNPQTTAVTANAGADLTGCKFQDVYITGELDGVNILWESIVGAVTGANGFIYKCTLIGPITVADNISINKCWVAPTAPNQEVVIDFNSVVKTVLISQWEQGKVVVKNMVAGSVLHLGGSAGALIIDSTVTGGEIVYGGGIRLAANNGTPDTLTDATTASGVWEVEKGADMHASQFNRRKHDNVADTITLYETDSVTPRKVFDADDDLTDITPQ